MCRHSEADVYELILSSYTSETKYFSGYIYIKGLGDYWLSVLISNTNPSAAVVNYVWAQIMPRPNHYTWEKAGNCVRLILIEVFL